MPISRRELLIGGGALAAGGAIYGVTRVLATGGSAKEYSATPAPMTDISEVRASTSKAESTPTAETVRFQATVWRSGKPEHDPRYDVFYDPSQGGSSDHPAYGWYYQKDLPSSSSREPHEVAIILQAPAKYRFTGPECQVWGNFDANHPFDQGELLLDRENKEIFVQPTEGKEHEAWIFIRCGGGAASGFSFEALQQLPQG